jgi:hypothetical protein
MTLTEPRGTEGLQRLLANEPVRHWVAAADSWVAVTDRRLIVIAERAVRLDIAFDRLRRVEFDIEQAQPATLVIVPASPASIPQVLLIPRDQYDAAAQAVAMVGSRLG